MRLNNLGFLARRDPTVYGCQVPAILTDGLTVFGIELVSRGTEIPWLAAIGALHSPVALLLLAVLAGHILMAFWHQFVRKDGVLRRIF